MAAQQQGNFAEAEKDWRAAVAENPQDAVAYANLGFVLAHQNKYGEAVPAYRKAANLAPGMPGIQLNWGIAEFKQGHFEEAIGPLTAAVTADPNSGQARTLLGLSCLRREEIFGCDHVSGAGGAGESEQRGVTEGAGAELPAGETVCVRGAGVSNDRGAEPEFSTGAYLDGAGAGWA